MPQATVTRSDTPAVTALVVDSKVIGLVAPGTIPDTIVMWEIERLAAPLVEELKLTKLSREFTRKPAHSNFSI